MCVECVCVYILPAEGQVKDNMCTLLLLIFNAPRMCIYSDNDWILLSVVAHLLSLKNKERELNPTHINGKKISCSRQLLSAQLY